MTPRRAPGATAPAAVPAPGRTRPLFPRLGDADGHRNDWDRALFRTDVLAGLAQPQKRLPSKYFYDAAGAALFDRICEQPEYYPTRAEISILTREAGAIADLLGPDVTLVELGSGGSYKTRLLLDRLREPRAYVPVDICAGYLDGAAARLHRQYPGLQVLPVCADFTHSFVLPPAATRAQKIAVFFPGSTIGNLDPHEAMLLLRKLHRRLGPGGWLLVGVDTKKNVETLERAYNDAAGVTAAFNANLLVRIRAELEGLVDPSGFEHLAYYNVAAGRIEMHLRSLGTQLIHVDGKAFRLRPGETIHTENSYKYAPEEFAALARDAGFKPSRLWLADGGMFSVHGLEA